MAWPWEGFCGGHPRWRPKSIKIYKKVNQKSLQTSIEPRIIFYLSFIELGIVFQGQGTQNLVKRLRHPSKSRKPCDVISDIEKISIRSDFGAILDISWGPKSRTNRKKRVLKKYKKVIMTNMLKKSHMGDHE